MVQQESGIAAFRKMTIVPLSIDGSIPQGFISQFQATKLDPNTPDIRALLPGIARRNAAFLSGFGEKGDLIDERET